jgi:hypothetical protein
MQMSYIESYYENDSQLSRSSRTSRLDRDYKRYAKANPYVLVNLECRTQLCGRFPTEQAAIEACEKRGGCKGVNGFEVYFARIPNL